MRRVGTGPDQIESNSQVVISNCCGAIGRCFCGSFDARRKTYATAVGLSFAAAAIVAGILIVGMHEGEDAKQAQIEKIKNMFKCVYEQTRFICANSHDDQRALNKLNHYLHNNTMVLVMGLLLAIGGPILGGAVGFALAYAIVTLFNYISENGVTSLDLPHFPTMTSARGRINYERQHDDEIELQNFGPTNDRP